jgi:Ca-activated chloride channel family protein
VRFAAPEAFQLLWIVPIVWIASIAFERRTRRTLQRGLGEKLAPFLSSSVSRAKRNVKLVLRLFAFTCFVVALARPQLGKSLQEVKVQGVEMMIAFDVSNSMLAEDTKPSRMQHAKTEMMKLMDVLAGDKVGLVAFAGSAVTISPLTTDKGSLKMFIDSLSTESVETQGTNFTKALTEANDAFARGGVDSDDTHKTTRVILVVSDGEDQEKGALELAKKLAGEGTRIFTLAVGTERGAPIPIRDERGFLRSYKRDRAGKEVLTTVHGDFLRELASTGQGAFHHATFGGPEAQMIKADLDKLQQSEFASSLATQYDERFQIPLLIGFLVLLGEMTMSERKAAGRIWKGRFEVTES